MSLRWVTIRYHSKNETTTVLVRFKNLADALWKLQRRTGIDPGAWKRIVHKITCNQEVGYRITVKSFWGKTLYLFD